MSDRTVVFAGILLCLQSSCSDDGDPSGADAICGNGVRESAEICDDGNTDSGDACSADCAAANCLVSVTYSTIQAGVDDGACSKLYVYSGQYAENITVSRNLEIEGVGAGDITISAASEGSVFTIEAGAVALRQLVIRDGRSSRGAGIYSYGTKLTLSGVSVRDNTAIAETDAAGGGIYNDGGLLTLIDSTVVGNRATSSGIVEAQPQTGPMAFGGGIFSYGGVVELRNSSIESNEVTLPFGHAVGKGGGIAVKGTYVTLTASSAVRDNVVEVEAVSQPATAQAGGIDVNDGTLVIDAASSVERNTVRARGDAVQPIDPVNPTGATAQGGGIAVVAGTVTLAGNSRIADNRVETVSSDRALSTAGAAYLDRSNMAMTASIISGNEAVAGSGDPSDQTRKSVASAQGGAVHATGSDPPNSIAITESSLVNNRADAGTISPDDVGSAKGGAIYAHVIASESSVRVVFDRSTISNNVAIADGAVNGGGCYGKAVLGETLFVANRSTLSGNQAQSRESGVALAGALYAEARISDAAVTVRLNNTTLSGNQALSASGVGWGGAIYASAGPGSAETSMDLSNVTIVANSASSAGGGAYLNEGINLSATSAIMRNTLVANNVADSGPDCYTGTTGTMSVDSAGYNLLSNSAECSIAGDDTGNLIGVDAMLKPLADNGGVTSTHALAGNSPAVDAGNPAGCTDHEGMVLATDQRGQSRSAHGRCDIGAFEFVP
ncbi:MAG: hypothetical protein MJE77_37070 [Proteobacteria bacterium]|nr:hypothetical protein [Pseudomonadota bacterium]